MRQRLRLAGQVQHHGLRHGAAPAVQALQPDDFAVARGGVAEGHAGIHHAGEDVAVRLVNSQAHHALLASARQMAIGVKVQQPLA